MTTQTTTGRSSRRTSIGRVLVVHERPGGGYACDIYRDGIVTDSCHPADLRGLMTVIGRERWTRIDLMARTTDPSQDWPSATVSLVQA